MLGHLGQDLTSLSLFPHLSNRDDNTNLRELDAIIIKQLLVPSSGQAPRQGQLHQASKGSSQLISVDWKGPSSSTQPGGPQQLQAWAHLLGIPRASFGPGHGTAWLWVSPLKVRVIAEFLTPRHAHLHTKDQGKQEQLVTGMGGWIQGWEEDFIIRFFIYLFIFGCVGSSLLCVGFL